MADKEPRVFPTKLDEAVSIVESSVGPHKRLTVEVKRNSYSTSAVRDLIVDLYSALLEIEPEAAEGAMAGLQRAKRDRECKHPEDERWFDQGTMRGGCKVCGASWAE